MDDAAHRKALEAAAGLTPVRPGSITLARHGEPALSRRVKLDAAGYRRWWAIYEKGGLMPGQTAPRHLKDAAREADLIIGSIRPRSIETAAAVAEGRPVAHEAKVVEAPLPPPHWPSFIRLSPRVWGVISRFWWWFFDHHAEGQESRREAQGRAEQVAAELVETAADGKNVLVVAHGFFNTMVGLELKKLGYRCVRDDGFKYWSQRRFEKTA